MDSCAKETGFKLPSPNEESMVDITADRAIAGTCFGRCVFYKLNLMKGDQLDMNAVRRHYNIAYKSDPEYAKDMANAFDHCHGKSETDMAKFLSSPLFKNTSAQFCAPMPSVIWACVLRHFLHNCPADRWSNTKECTAVQEFSKNCKDALTKI